MRKKRKWKEAQDVGRKKVKCVGSGNVSEWRKRKEEESNKDSFLVKFLLKHL